MNVYAFITLFLIDNNEKDGKNNKESKSDTKKSKIIGTEKSDGVLVYQNIVKFASTIVESFDTTFNIC